MSGMGRLGRSATLAAGCGLAVIIAGMPAVQTHGATRSGSASWSGTRTSVNSGSYSGSRSGSVNGNTYSTSRSGSVSGGSYSGTRSGTVNGNTYSASRSGSVSGGTYHTGGWNGNSWSGSTNVNVNRNVNAYGYGGGYPVGAGVAVGVAAGATAVAIGSMARTLPPSCGAVVVNGMTYQQCGATWYQPQYVGTQVTYIAVNPPG